MSEPNLNVVLNTTGNETEELPMFDPRCPQCGRFLSMKEAVHWFNGLEEYMKTDGAICKKHGEVQPNFLGWV